MDYAFEWRLGDNTGSSSLVNDEQLGYATQSRPEECKGFNRAVRTGPSVAMFEGAGWQ